MDTNTRDTLRVDELRHPWLTLLLDTYIAADTGISEDIGALSKGRAVACAKGCDACCSLKDIPIYPLELNGIYWYVIEKLPAETKARLKPRLSASAQTGECPFLLDGACSIYDVRPIACRQFIVYGRRCAQGEDPFHTRRADVLSPSEGWRLRAFAISLGFYGPVPKDDFHALMSADEVIQTLARNLKSHPWAKLSELI